MQKKFEPFTCEDCSSRGHSLFNNLCAIHLSHLTKSKHTIHYKKGQTLFFEGTRPIGIYCINSGHVKITKNSSSGKEQIMYLANPGEIVGYRSLLCEELYAASGTVLDDAIICFIPKEDFLDILHNDSQLYKTLMKAVCKQMGILEEKLAKISMLSVRERLAAALLMLKETYSIEGEISTTINIALSREDLANLIGTATETLIRLLSEFKTDGYIELTGKKIKVLDPKGLAKTANFYS